MVTDIERRAAILALETLEKHCKNRRKNQGLYPNYFSVAILDAIIELKEGEVDNSRSSADQST